MRGIMAYPLRTHPSRSATSPHAPPYIGPNIKDAMSIGRFSKLILNESPIGICRNFPNTIDIAASTAVIISARSLLFFI